MDICQERLVLYAVFFFETWKTPHPLVTMKRNVREQKIRERGVNHENHENIMSRKFGAIRYLVISIASMQIQKHGEGLGNLVTYSDIRRIRRKTMGATV